MNIPKINSINFQKTLRANCKVLDYNRQPCNCKIYELDEKDENYFKKITKEPSWKHATYLNFINDEVKYYNPNDKEYHIYTIENSNGDCLGFTSAINNKRGYEITILESAPWYRNDKKGTCGYYKYVGETLVSFLVKDALKSNQTKIEVDADEDAIEFYKNSKFVFRDIDFSEMYLDGKNFKALIKQNEKHTKGKIDIVS